MKGREAKLREPPETHDLRKCPELSDFSKKESTVPLQIIRGIGKPNQCGYGFIEQCTAICSEQFHKTVIPIYSLLTVSSFCLAVQEYKSELKIFFLHHNG